MVLYKVFYKNYEPERSKDLRGMTQFESGMKWAKIFFDGLVKDKETIFFLPIELKYAEG